MTATPHYSHGPDAPRRGVWCVGRAPDDQLVLAAVDSRGIWLRVSIVPMALEGETRRFLQALLDASDPLPGLALVR